MTRRTPRTCRRSGCDRPMYMGGLCAEHLEEDRQRTAREERAVRALHEGVTLSDPGLQEELAALRQRWFRVCDAVNFERYSRQLPQEEARYAVSWCIALAQAILDADPVVAAGKPAPYELEDARHWVGERFRNLDAGLMSNGLPREASR